MTGLFSREELLGGLPARRASMALFAVEARAAHFAARSQLAMAQFVTEETFEEQEHAFLDAIAHKRALPHYPSIRDLERFAPDWSPLAPEDVGVRAALAHLIAEKHKFRFRDVPQLRQVLALDSSAVQQTYQRLYHQPLDSIYARQVSLLARARWLWARAAFQLENLSPFASAYALTLTETIGGSILALPIALAGIGPLASVALLIILGLVNIVTIVGVSEAAVRNGNMRYWGGGFISQLVSNYLGGSSSTIFSIGLVISIFALLIAFYVGVATTLEAVTGVRAELWALALFLVNLYFLRSRTLYATVAFALAIGIINITLILTISMLALPHIHVANLLYFNLPFINGRPPEPSTLRLIFGVVLLAYFGHTSTANCARVVLRREPTGRALILGNIAAMATAIVLYCIWIIAINGAIEPEKLVGETGTIIGPLADTVGRGVEVLGSIYVVLGMGMVSVHYSLGLFRNVRDLLPTHLWHYVLSARSRFWLAIAPVAIVFVVIEALLFTNRGSYSGTLGFFGVLKGSILGGIFPMLMLVASRHKGDYVPGLVIRFLGNPILVGGIYLIFLGSIFLHGLFIWQDPLQRLAALVVGIVAVAMPIVFIKRGNFKPRAIVELRVEQNTGGKGAFHIIANGEALAADVRLTYENEEQVLEAANGQFKNFATLKSATFQLPSGHAEELKVWVHEITEDGVSEWLPAKVEVSSENKVLAKELVDRETVLPLNGNSCRVNIQFLPSEEAMLKAFSAA